MYSPIGTDLNATTGPPLSVGVSLCNVIPIRFSPCSNSQNPGGASIVPDITMVVTQDAVFRLAKHPAFEDSESKPDDYVGLVGNCVDDSVR